jgi:hypothetical protein
MRFENAAEPSISNICGADSIRLNVLLRYPFRNLLARCNGLRPSHVCPVFLAMPDPVHFVSSNSREYPDISRCVFRNFCSIFLSCIHPLKATPFPPCTPGAPQGL